MSMLKDDLAASEATRQADKKATPTAAGHLTADLAHYRRLLTYERTYKVSMNALAAIHALGGNDTAGDQTGMPANFTY